MDMNDAETSRRSDYDSQRWRESLRCYSLARCSSNHWSSGNHCRDASYWYTALLIDQEIQLTLIDCGLTHYDDAIIKKALREIAPDQIDAIDEFQSGEIKGS